jgi:hypothetical protein
LGTGFIWGLVLFGNKQIDKPKGQYNDPQHKEAHQFEHHHGGEVAGGLGCGAKVSNFGIHVWAS